MKTDSLEFWEKHSQDYKTAFEQLDELAQYLEQTESRHVFRVITTHPDMRVLDLGCGTGRWAFEFARRCKQVVAADFSKGMVDRCRESARQLELRNLEFRVSSIQEFRCNEQFDLIIISGVLVYLDDEELLQVLRNVKNMLKPDGQVVSRETVAIKDRVEIRKEFHRKIGDTYSATYRLASQYERVFAEAGLTQIYANDFAPTNIPMILFRRLIPHALHDAKLARQALRLGLRLQLLADPFLVRHQWLYRPIMNRFWDIKSMLFVYGIDPRTT